MDSIAVFFLGFTVGACALAILLVVTGLRDSINLWLSWMELAARLYGEQDTSNPQGQPPKAQE